LECPRARERIRIGLPLTVEQSSRKHQSQGVEAANAGLVVAATETFITFLDALHIGMCEKDVLHPLLEDIIHAADQVSKDFEGRAKIVQWLITLHQMKASEKLTDEQVRECQFDINTAYKGFKAKL
jgi:ESCRT-I complex subunit VPS28